MCRVVLCCVVLCCVVLCCVVFYSLAKRCILSRSKHFTDTSDYSQLAHKLPPFISYSSNSLPPSVIFALSIIFLSHSILFCSVLFCSFYFLFPSICLSCLFLRRGRSRCSLFCCVQSRLGRETVQSPDRS